MQQDNTNNLLQQLENQQLPDLSQMDAHWDSMQALLQRGADRKPKGFPFAKWFVAASLFGLLIFIFWKNDWFAGSKKDLPPALSNNSQQTVPPVKLNAVITDTVKQNANVVVTPASPSFIADNPDDYGTDAKFTHQAPVTINFYPCDSSGVISSNNLPDSVKAAYAKQQEEEMNQQAMQQFWSQLEKPSQQFIIDNRRDTNLVCSEGTTMAIPAGAFLNTAEKITIEVKEYYAYEEMLLNKLSTTSNGQQLISDGMLSVKAFQAGKEVHLAGIKKMQISMPRRDTDESMQLFSGQMNNVAGDAESRSPLNWLPIGSFLRESGNGYFITVFDPYGAPYRLKGKDGSVTGKFLLARDCEMSVAKALEGLNQHFGMFYNKIKLRRSWSKHPHKLFSKEPLPVVGDSIQMPYNIARQLRLASKKDIERVEQQIKQDAIRRRTTSEAAPVYKFEMPQLGYINCDRFYDAGERMEYVFDLGTDKKPENFISMMAFKRIRSVMPGIGFNATIKFSQIPKKEEAYFICLGVKDGKIYSCIKPCTGQAVQAKDLEFLETNAEDFKKKITALNL